MINVDGFNGVIYFNILGPHVSGYPHILQILTIPNSGLFGPWIRSIANLPTPRVITDLSAL